jgi:hypothetical protein
MLDNQIRYVLTINTNMQHALYQDATDAAARMLIPSVMMCSLLHVHAFALLLNLLLI